MEPKQKIKLPVPYKIETKLKLLNKIGTEKILSFIGSIEVESMFYLYLFKKYRSNCFLHDRQMNRRALGISILIFKNYTDNERREQNDHLYKLATTLVSCMKKQDTKIIIIPVQLVFDNNSAHANVLIYRKTLNQIEHFEPHGGYYLGSTDLISTNKIINDWMNVFINQINNQLHDINKPKVNFIPSTEVCPRIEGLQKIEESSKLPKLIDVEPGGYCSAWSMFFTELSLKNPDIPSSTLLTYIYNILMSMNELDQKNYLKNVIRGYSVFINEKIEKYFSIFINSGLTISKIKGFSGEQRRLFNELLKNIISKELNMSIQDNDGYRRFIDKNIKNRIDELLGKKNIFDKFNITSKPTETSLMSVLTVTKSFHEEKEQNPKQISIKTQKVKSCPEGKEINPKTGRCIKINPKTGRYIEQISWSSTDG